MGRSFLAPAILQFPSASLCPTALCIHEHTHSLALESINDTVPLAQIVVNRLELPQDLLGILDGRLILQQRLVVRQVNLGCRRLERRVLVDGGSVTCSESLELRSRLFTESETLVDLGPLLYISWLVTQLVWGSRERGIPRRKQRI